MKYLSAPSNDKKTLNIIDDSIQVRGKDKIFSNIQNNNIPIYSINTISNNKNNLNNNNFYISSNNKDINIFDNYIKNDNIGNSNTTYNLMNHTKDTFPYDSKLHYQLLRKRKERSSCYNFLLLTTFNLNISHFCFPYLLTQIGLVNLIIILFICGFFSYLVHSGLIKFVSNNKEISNLNFADLINSHFNSFCAWFVEIGMIFWFIYNMVNFYTTLKNLIFFYCYKLGFVDLEQEDFIFCLVFHLITYIFLLFINRIKSPSIVDISVIFGFCINQLSVILYAVLLIYNININSENDSQTSSSNLKIPLFIFNFDEILNSFNIVNSAINSIIVFVWVNKKLTNTSISKHSKIVKLSFVFLFIHYLLYICLTFFPENSFLDYRNKFYLLPNFKREIDFTFSSFGGIIKLLIITINVMNQIFSLNFHFLVIKQIILRQEHIRLFQGKRYFLWFSLILLICAFFSFFEFDPYNVILICNGSFGYFINYIIPTFLYVKISKEKFLSKGIIFRLLLVFIVTVFTYASLYEYILKSLDMK